MLSERKATGRAMKLPAADQTEFLRTRLQLYKGDSGWSQAAVAQVESRSLSSCVQTPRHWPVGVMIDGFFSVP
jgi:hypothetical protein